MAAVINFPDDSITLAQSVKRSKTAYAIFPLDNTGTCLPSYSSTDFSGSCEERWDRFSSNLPKDSCAYCLAEFSYISPADGVKRSKTVFVMWAPSQAPRKDKMMIAFSSNGIVNKIGSGGIACRIQAGSQDGVSYQQVMEQVLSRSTVK